MNRAMFAGVSGLKAHQTKMDVIGNNIANVNTYGYKAQRAVFSDVYYQTLRGASAGSANRGGTNPSSVGYGSALNSVQAQMTSSSMQSTGFGLDVAITGEGFLQVQDGAGNIFYTKAGMLDYDANGYLTDINGNFVLGASGTSTEPGTDRIKLDNIGSVEAAKPSNTTTINGIEYEITASNATEYGNVSLAIGSSEDLPAGMSAKANISSTGAITVQLNAYEKFESMAELNKVINEAILEANGGNEHPGGTFTIEASENVFGKDAVNGFVTGSTIEEPMVVNAGDSAKFFGGKLAIGEFKPTKVNGGATTSPTFTVKPNTPATSPSKNKITATIDGIDYVAEDVAMNTKFPLILKSADGGTLELEKVSDTDGLLESDFTAMAETPQAIVVSAPNYFLGGAKVTGVSTTFPISGDPVFTAGTANDNGEYDLEIKVGGKTYKGKAVPGKSVVFECDSGKVEDGTITMSFPAKEEMLKNLGLAQDVKGTAITTALQAKDNEPGMHKISIKKAEGASVQELTGAQIAGQAGGVEKGTITGENNKFFNGSMTIEGVSGDFKGSGTVDPDDFKATYGAGDPSNWNVSMEIGGVKYEGTLDKDTKADSLLLKSPNGDYIEVSNPGFDEMTKAFQKANDGKDPLNGQSMQSNPMGDENKLTVTPSKLSENLGLGSDDFILSGGTEGGAITLDELSSIAIGSDGVVTVSHASKGVVVAGKISLASFANPSGLQLMGTNYYAESVNSGEAQLADPGMQGTGALKSSALEMSNVDLSEQMAEMITTQRGFQANSRVITITDTMLEELINLKR